MEEADEISRQVQNALDSELAAKESEIAEKFGAVETNTSELPSNETIEEVKDKLDKGKEEKYEPSVEFPLNSAAIAPPAKKKLKPELISDILELQSKIGSTEWEEAKLKRMKKAELEIILAGLLEKGASKITGMDLAERDAMGRKFSSADSIAKNLYTMNMVLCGFMERMAGTEHITPYTGGSNLLQGWTENIDSQRDALIQALSEIYMKHSKTIDVYFSPLTRYAMIMLCSLAITVGNNTQKKKEN